MTCDMDQLLCVNSDRKFSAFWRSFLQFEVSDRVVCNLKIGKPADLWPEGWSSISVRLTWRPNVDNEEGVSAQLRSLVAVPR
eukprot:m.27200 g.27200  ORF g.27200 m.27200 type:complete len:82 (+) comp29844_c0_seq2:523-768(+)